MDVLGGDSGWLVFFWLRKMAIRRLLYPFRPFVSCCLKRVNQNIGGVVARQLPFQGFHFPRQATPLQILVPEAIADTLLKFCFLSSKWFFFSSDIRQGISSSCLSLDDGRLKNRLRCQASNNLARSDLEMPIQYSPMGSASGRPFGNVLDKGRLQSDATRPPSSSSVKRHLPPPGLSASQPRSGECIGTHERHCIIAGALIAPSQSVAGLRLPNFDVRSRCAMYYVRLYSVGLLDTDNKEHKSP